MGNSNFNPALPNVYKFNDIVNRISGDIKAYVDDLRALGWSLEHAWAIAERESDESMMAGEMYRPFLVALSAHMLFHP